MTNEGNDCTCLPDCYCATHDTDTASRQTDRQCSTLDWRVSGEFWSLYKLNPRQKPALEILRQENLDNSCPCFWHPLLHLIWWRSGDVPLLSSLHHFLSTCRRMGRGAWGFVVFFVMRKGRNVAQKKPSLTANEELRKEEDGSDGGGVEGGDWFLPSFSPLNPPLTLRTLTPPSLTRLVLLVCFTSVPLCYLKSCSFFSFMFAMRWVNVAGVGRLCLLLCLLMTPGWRCW